LTDDQYSGETFDYFLANPPFGVDWKKPPKKVKGEHQSLHFNGRFGADLPKVNDRSLLFLQHQISKFEPYQPDRDKKGSRLAIVFNDSPLCTGVAGSGESGIRQWIIESDWLETIIALPEQMFYKTDSETYIWIVTNRKPKHRQGKIQLIDADHGFVVQEYRNFVETETSKIFDNQEFGYHRVTIERPLRLLYQMDVDRKSRFLDGVPHLLYDVQAIDQQLGREPRLDWNEVEQLIKDLLKQRSSQWKKAEHKLFRDVFTERDPEAEPVILKERKATGETNARVWGWFAVPGQNQERMYEADLKLRDFEKVNLQDEVSRYFLEEVAPHVPDAWADGSKIKRGYEINFQRYFYKYNPPRPLAEIDADIKRMEQEIIRLLREV
ncbi:MAG: HsdM family class I SAM-dependent methyltransferase, partial [Planktothrix sp.]